MSNRISWARGVAALAAATLLAACDGGGPSAPGALTVTLVSPNGAEGSAHVRLFGAGLEAVGELDARVFGHRKGDTLDVVVVRDEPGELRFRVQVADTTVRPVGTVLEVADAQNALRGGLSGYRVEVRP